MPCSTCRTHHRFRPLLALGSVLALLLIASAARSAPPAIVIAEGEQFAPQDAKGWKITHQDDTYGSHTYGGMWMSQGASLGAPSDSVGSVATKSITVPEAGKYRVWSKYQAPPYFQYLHKIEVVQGGKVVFSHVYGKPGVDRLWSFSGVSDELWWPWGVDHDAAEAPKTLVDLQAGPAELRLTTEKQASPAGDRFIDFVVLTTNPNDEYQGFKPYGVGSPFTMEALAATKLYMRFQNTGTTPAKLTVSRQGHFQPQYGGATTQIPEQPTAAGQWSTWVDIGPFCRLVHDEGLTLKLGAATFKVQFALDAEGKQVVGDMTVQDGEAVVVPIDITWKKGAVVKPSRQHAEEIIAESKTWRKANGGKKPQQIAFYGSFVGNEKWVTDLKDVMGYNTHLPDSYPHLQRDKLHAHAGSVDAIKAYAATVPDKSKVRVVSFGDEIGLGQINYNDPKLQTKFIEWLKGKKIDPTGAKLANTGDPKWVWYSNLFNEEERFAEYREMTRVTKELLGADVLTGANYSPHHLALCYGPIFQWVDIFKHQGMSMFWAEDYIFSVPEAPQILSWMYGQMRCATKYHNQPIHCYIMPHAPGQEADFLRRDMLLAIGYGSKHIDSFWVGPEERFTENYVAWNYRDTFRAIGEAIHDTAAIESIQMKGKLRPSRVAVITGKATDFNESRLMVPKANDPFTAKCKNAPEKVNQILCRKEQQMLYLALRQAQHSVDLITEDDIVDLDVLKQYEVVYFAGEWVDERIVPKLDVWVKNGGTLVACAGLGHRNQFDQPTTAMLSLLGLKSADIEKNAAIYRTLLELPLMPTIDTITMNGANIDAVCMKQKLIVADSETATIATWQKGGSAVTHRKNGKGHTFAIGALPGTNWIKSDLPIRPWARGGRHTLYSPTKFNAAATSMVRIGFTYANPVRDVVCSSESVEGVLMDADTAHLLTLVNWQKTPAKGLVVKVKLTAAPKEVKSIATQKAIPFQYANGEASFTFDLPDADYVVITK